MVNIMDQDVLNIFLGIFFIIVVPTMIIISLQIFEDDDIKKERKLKWHND